MKLEEHKSKMANVESNRTVFSLKHDVVYRAVAMSYLPCALKHGVSDWTERMHIKI